MPAPRPPAHRLPGCPLFPSGFLERAESSEARTGGWNFETSAEAQRMLAQITSGAVLGVDAFLVRVEVDLARGLPCMNVVGLPESAVREGRERVSAARKAAATAR